MTAKSTKILVELESVELQADRLASLEAELDGMHGAQARHAANFESQKAAWTTDREMLQAQLAVVRAGAEKALKILKAGQGGTVANAIAALKAVLRP
jgi:hypothetical protein